MWLRKVTRHWCAGAEAGNTVINGHEKGGEDENQIACIVWKVLEFCSARLRKFRHFVQFC